MCIFLSSIDSHAVVLTYSALTFQSLNHGGFSECTTYATAVLIVS